MIRKVVQLIDSIINGVIIVFCVLLLAYGGYSLWETAQINNQADSSYYHSYKPTDELSLEELQKINPDVLGWLTIKGTHIDYPLVQGTDNVKYVNTNAKGDFSLSGSLFLDYRNAKDFSDMNTIIYGHHMDNKTMFGDLGNFKKKKYFLKHRYGQLYYGNQWHKIEFLAFIQTDAYNSTLYSPYKSNSSEQLAYVSQIKKQAKYVRDVTLSSSEHFVVLSTCEPFSTNGRYVLIGHLL